jgi:hypothetical protein
MPKISSYLSLATCRLLGSHTAFEWQQLTAQKPTVADKLYTSVLFTSVLCSKAEYVILYLIGCTSVRLVHKKLKKLMIFCFTMMFDNKSTLCSVLKAHSKLDHKRIIKYDMLRYVLIIKKIKYAYDASTVFCICV